MEQPILQETHECSSRYQTPQGSNIRKKKSKNYFSDVQEYIRQVPLPEGETEWEDSQSTGDTDPLLEGEEGSSTENRSGIEMEVDLSLTIRDLT